MGGRCSAEFRNVLAFCGSRPELVLFGAGFGLETPMKYNTGVWSHSRKMRVLAGEGSGEVAPFQARPRTVRDPCTRPVESDASAAMLGATCAFCIA